MCGIAGVYAPGRDVDPAVVRRMTASLAHRGPDDDGFHVAPGSAMGMRRLSIIDLDTGRQPIANEDESLWIVYNGEVYNYRSLTAELEAAGHRFRTRSDTEVLLHAYEQHGADCVHRLNGMFAFAIRDLRRDALFIARDRLGIKPLYYAWDGATLVYASEIKAILESGLVRREIDPTAVWHYLTFRYVPAPLTIWKGIHKLPPAHTLTFDARMSEPVVRRYWDLSFSDGTGECTERHVAEFSGLFLDAVKHRLIADVPVGIFLSGGLDSSAVAAAVAEVHNAPLSTFSVAFREGGEFSELSYAREVAAHFGTDHHEVEIGATEFLDFLPRFVWQTDEPLADPASVPLYYLARLARQQVKVVLSGEGSDEVLAGYTFDQRVAQWASLERWQRLPRLLRSTIPEMAMRSAGMSGAAERLAIRNVSLADRNSRLLPHMTRFFETEEKLSLFGVPAFAAPESQVLVRDYYARAGTKHPLHQMLYAYCQDWLVEDLLMKADKMTMAESLELRVPFLDFRLVEWLAAAPAACKVNASPRGRFTTKFLLRRFAESRLPRSILDRPKQGFPVPITGWFATGGPLSGLAHDLMAAGDSRLRAMFDGGALDEVLRRGIDGTNAQRHRLWLLLVLELWLRRWT